MAQSMNHGRGAISNPPNRFEKIELTWEEESGSVPTEYYLDTTKSILSENDSPDVNFRFSVNPYRGCEHGCIYCYARPTHEYLGFSAGIDFESRIMVKKNAPHLLEKAFQSRSWRAQTVALSGATDPYQPAERQLELTRRCLELFLEYRNPVQIITKNSLITRDADILRDLARKRLVFVHFSITSLDAKLVRIMEPRAAAPARRLEALETLALEGIPVGVNTAPIIPGLNDEEIPAVLGECASRGARSAAYILLRLPGAVEPLFSQWLEKNLPLRAAKIMGQLPQVRSGKLSDSRFGSRMSGEGPMAESIRDLFQMTCQKLHLNEKPILLSTDQFRRPLRGQLGLFRETAK